MEKYLELKRYEKYRTWREFEVSKSTLELESNSIDAVFVMNVMDHVENPEAFMDEIHRICRGRLFFYVDVNKEPDKMHPHKISNLWLTECFRNRFSAIYVYSEPSWKFSNNIFWFVGDKK